MTDATTTDHTADGATSALPSTPAATLQAAPEPVTGIGVPQTLKTTAGITWRVLILIAGLAVAAAILNTIFPVVFALFFALLVTAWTGPVMRVFQKAKLPKVVAMLVSLVLIAVAIVFVLFMVIRSTIDEGPKLASSISAGFSQIHDWLKTGPLQLSDAQVDAWVAKGQDLANQIGHGLLGEALGVVGSFGTLVIAGSVFVFGVIFFLMQGKQIWAWVVSWMPKSISRNVDISGEIAWDSISGYARGIVIVALADAFLVFIGLLILQVPLAPALAALVFLGALIPVIGAPIATFFAALVALAERGPVIALFVIVLTVIVGSVDGDVMQPLVMGKAVNLHPLAIIFAIAAGSIAMGIVGALIAVPITGAVYGVARFLTGRDPREPIEHLPAETVVPAS